MKNINEKFTDEEFAEMKMIKENQGFNWHDMIFYAIRMHDDGEASMRTLDVLNDPELMEQIEQSERDISAGNCTPLSALINVK